MTINLTTTQRIVVAVLGVVVLILVLSLGIKKSTDQTPVIPASVAVDRALEIANQANPDGGAVAPPVEARGETLTYGQAVQFVFGRPINATESAAYNPDFPVWLVVLRGQFVEHVPASADGSTPAKDVLHTQMAIIMDGDSTQSIARVMISPTQPLAVDSLPVLPLPAGGLAATSTPAPTDIFAPAPTQGS